MFLFCPLFYGETVGETGKNFTEFHKILEDSLNKEKTAETLVNSRFSTVFLGGDNRVRTGALLNAIQALSQLSYTPI